MPLTSTSVWQGKIGQAGCQDIAESIQTWSCRVFDLTVIRSMTLTFAPCNSSFPFPIPSHQNRHGKKKEYQA